MPTIEQIRAARALIGWSQGELAEHAGLSQTGIARIENGTNHPNATTTAKITAAFDKVDVEFIGESGVKKRTGEVRTLRGADGLKFLVDDIYHYTKNEFEKKNNIESLVYLYNARPENWHKWLGKDWWDMHSERMSKMNKKIQRLLISEGDNYLISSSFSEHRQFPSDKFNDQSIYAYSNKLAFVTFDQNLVIRVLENKQFCEGFRVLFDVAWETIAKPVK
ncbi:MAG: helix-turn-helix domain-containing protein [Alphaproteobacteria bacterium]